MSTMVSLVAPQVCLLGSQMDLCAASTLAGHQLLAALRRGVSPRVSALPSAVPLPPCSSASGRCTYTSAARTAIGFASAQPAAHAPQETNPTTPLTPSSSYMQRSFPKPVGADRPIAGAAEGLERVPFSRPVWMRSPLADSLPPPPFHPTPTHKQLKQTAAGEAELRLGQEQTSRAQGVEAKEEREEGVKRLASLQSSPISFGNSQSPPSSWSPSFSDLLACCDCAPSCSSSSSCPSCCSLDGRSPCASPTSCPSTVCSTPSGSRRTSCASASPVCRPIADTAVPAEALKMALAAADIKRMLQIA
eukprot:GHVT01048851.1.p1 GENE.GHVT01048851.1~~GHVT01048851.1.p1  ORF type:complete len:305 (+),score=69.28 GHVT01048851.1:644-1558(+)